MPAGVPCRVGSHVTWDPMPRGIRCSVGTPCLVGIRFAGIAQVAELTVFGKPCAADRSGFAELDPDAFRPPSAPPHPRRECSSTLFRPPFRTQPPRSTQPEPSFSLNVPGTWLPRICAREPSRRRRRTAALGRLGRTGGGLRWDRARCAEGSAAPALRRAARCADAAMRGIVCDGLGSLLPHLHRDWARPLPHLHRDRAGYARCTIGRSQTSRSSRSTTRTSSPRTTTVCACSSAPRSLRARCRT
jgi:hypothetical protein